MDNAFGEKIKKIREYKGLSGSEFGEKLSLGKQAISMIESGKRGMSVEQIQSLVLTYKIDPRYLFGGIDDVSEADLSKRGEDPGQTQLESLKKEIIQLKDRVNPVSKMDPVAERVLANQDLHDLVELVQFWDSSMLRRFRDIAYGYVSGIHDERENQKALKESRGEEKVG